MFVPQDFGFVFAKVQTGNKTGNIKILTDWLMYWLKFKHASKERGSVIFDIDDTLINEKQEPIIEMRNVYKLCQNLGFIINIITARPESFENRKATEAMLLKNGFTHFEALYMMPSELNISYKTISMYKYNARVDISKRHTIIANCGDMWTDHAKHLSVKALNKRDAEESAICFLPGQGFPCIKLPAASVSLRSVSKDNAIKKDGNGQRKYAFHGTQR